MLHHSQMNVSGSSKAIVIGGGIAGLLAARVLTNHFDQVTIVERDRFPKKPQPRQGVPQSHYLHVLLARGEHILEQLFPGIKDELAGNGAPSVDWTADFRLLLGNSWAPRFPSGINSRACTRNLLEVIIHKRLVNEISVELLESNYVMNLLTNVDNTTVIGVQVRDSNGKEKNITAQLVVDASGHGSKTPKWLQGLGYKIPQKTTVKSSLGYAIRSYETLGGSPLNCKVLYLMPKAPTQSRGAVIQQVEHGNWLVELIGVDGDYPPIDEAGFLNFARSMPIPEVYNAIKDGKPISPIYGYRRRENCWRRYELMSQLPENFVILGDAACTFNPIYGQGITVAALGALTLDECLRERSNSTLTGLTQRFQKKLAKVNTTPWLMATGDEFRWPTTQGEQANFITRMMQRYLARVMLLATEREKVYKALVEVMHLLNPPTVLFKPSILAQVILAPFHNGSMLFWQKHSNSK